MFRPTALRSFQRTLSSCNVPATPPAWHGAIFKVQSNPKAPVANATKRLSLAVRKPLVTSLVRSQSTMDKAAEEEYRKRTLQTEKEYRNRTLQGDPDSVSLDSSVRHLTDEVGVNEPEPDVDMTAGIKGDFVRSYHCLKLFGDPAEVLHSFRKSSWTHSPSRTYRGKHSTLAWPACCHTLLLPFQRFI